ncbi:DNA-binding transcriptional MerR regulator [Inhella inkyongensis]|uniref:DNA-binding transcriptional MerR regulator n=1 Tax=Inhella inkyongensis TaxID=392593 RepID=A0A840S7A1_9BURK|nr:MerR family transcriptional regulator [Inhella inkyongensis]MBB5206345.1 DNA-binding transcriptional MerR regulator [Inhella inkyongensis]
MRIGELATHSGLSREALRFYERIGLLRARRLPNGYRDYPPQSLALLRLVRQAQGLGFSLAEVRQALQEGGSAEDVGAWLQAKLGETEARLADLQGLRQQLLELTQNPCPLTCSN